jgi:hypothetical protein
MIDGTHLIWTPVWSSEALSSLEWSREDRLKKFKENLVAGTDQDWIEEVIDEQEGTVGLLPQELVAKGTLVDTSYKNPESVYWQVHI